MPRINSKPKDAAALPTAVGKPTLTRTRTSERLQSKIVNASKCAHATKATNDNNENPTIEPPAKSMATRSRSRTRREVLVEESQTLNCHPPRNPPEYPIKLNAGKKASKTVRPPRRTTKTKEEMKVKDAARVKAKRAQGKVKALPKPSAQFKAVAQSPQAVIPQQPTQRELRAQRRAAAKGTNDEGRPEERRSDEGEAPLVGQPVTPTVGEAKSDAKVDTLTDQSKKGRAGERPTPGAVVGENDQAKKIRDGRATQKTLKRRYEDEDNEDEDEKVKRVSASHSGADENLEDGGPDQQAKAHESVSALRKSKAVGKKRRVAHDVREASAFPDENTPVKHGARAETDFRHINVGGGGRQGRALLDNIPVAAGAPESGVPFIDDADEILSKLLSTARDDDLESIGSQEEAELEYPPLELS